MANVFPSLIAANPLYLGDALKALEPHCAGFHCDIMDNHFVPNLTFGAQTVNAIDAATPLPSWVHLMVDNPIEWCKSLQIKPNSIVSFHIESGGDSEEIIKRIKENNWCASITINPKTAVEEIYPYLNMIDQVLIMSVEPGFSGQRFLPSAVEKVEPLIAQREKNKLSFTLGMDGGINSENITTLIEAGVTDCVVGAAIFDQTDPVTALEQLEKLT